MCHLYRQVFSSMGHVSYPTRTVSGKKEKKKYSGTYFKIHIYAFMHVHLTIYIIHLSLRDLLLNTSPLCHTMETTSGLLGRGFKHPSYKTHHYALEETSFTREEWHTSWR